MNADAHCAHGSAVESGPNRDSPARILGVTLVVCIVCSVAVATAAVMLKPLQDANQNIERERNVLVVGGLLDPDRSIPDQFAKKVEPRVVDLETGRFTDAVSLAVAESPRPKDMVRISPRHDIARIGSRSRYGVVYLVREGKKIRRVIVPIRGKGLWSMLKGFIALEGDLDTVAGISFYEQGETPGLGAEITNPRWQHKWQGKLAYDNRGRLAIEVIKGAVDPTRSNASHEVDGIAGATLTSRGVSHLVRYWLGVEGYGLFVKWLREQIKEGKA